jgi:hypothetical protein
MLALWDGSDRDPSHCFCAGREFTFHPDSGELIEIVITAAGDATVELRPAAAVACSVAEAVPVVSWDGPSASGNEGELVRFVLRLDAEDRLEFLGSL